MPGFEEFFRDAYRPLVRDVIFAGWNPDEAEDAVSAAMIEVLPRATGDHEFNTIFARLLSHRDRMLVVF